MMKIVKTICGLIVDIAPIIVTMIMTIGAVCFVVAKALWLAMVFFVLAVAVLAFAIDREAKREAAKERAKLISAIMENGGHLEIRIWDERAES